MSEQLHSFMESGSVADLVKKVERLQAASTAVKELKEGASKAAQSLKSHIQSRQRAAARKRKQEQKNLEQAAVKKKKMEAKDAAMQLVDKAARLPELFSCDWATVCAFEGSDPAFKAVTTVEGPAKGSVATLDAPVLLTAYSGQTEFLKDPKVVEGTGIRRVGTNK